jgi:hypothetical protein
MVFFNRGASLKFIQTKINDTTVLHGGFGFIQRRQDGCIWERRFTQTHSINQYMHNHDYKDARYRPVAVKCIPNEVLVEEELFR